MSNRVIDARERFIRSSTPVDKSVIAQQSAEALQRQQRDATELRNRLKETVRLTAADRKVLARNLGRAIERKPGLNPKAVCRDLFVRLYGEAGGQSKDKKRKRYIRFDGEPLNDHGPNEEYAADGHVFLRLIEGLADQLEPGTSIETARDQMVLFVCNGVSFYGPARPQLLNLEANPIQIFRDTMGAFMDKVCRDTDLVAYLSEVRHYTIETYPNSRGDLTSDVLDNLHRQLIPVERFDYAADQEQDGYTRLRLDGFNVGPEGVSSLYPGLRLARIYWPRQVLCLPASVPTSVLNDIRIQRPSASELASVRAELREGRYWATLTPSEQIELAVKHWRGQREQELWRGALQTAGIDPDRIEWGSFEEGEERNAVKGAEWRTFWATTNVNLHIIADGGPEAVQFGLEFRSEPESWWTDGLKDLLQPCDDDKPGSDLRRFKNTDLSDNDISWMPAGERTYVCRWFSKICGNDENGNPLHTDFDDEFVPDMRVLLEKRLWPLLAPESWNLLTRRMNDWQIYHHDFGSTRRDDTAIPALRPLFDAPSRWTPAPDGSLASAILRSLSFAEGEARLDSKMIAAVNARVHCFAQMKAELLRRFQMGLSRNGYAEGLI